MPRVRTGYLFGVFDLFHVAHLDAVRAAGLRCDRLVIGVATDELVEEVCGVRPFVPQIERLEIVAALRAIADVRPLSTLELSTELVDTQADLVFLPAEGLDAVQSAAVATFGPLNAAGIDVVRLDATRRTASTAVRDALARTTDASSVA